MKCDYIRELLALYLVKKPISKSQLKLKFHSKKLHYTILRSTGSHSVRRFSTYDF